MLLKIWYKPVASVAEEEWRIKYGGGLENYKGW